MLRAIKHSSPELNAMSLYQFDLFGSLVLSKTVNFSEPINLLTATSGATIRLYWNHERTVKPFDGLSGRLGIH